MSAGLCTEVEGRGEGADETSSAPSPHQGRTYKVRRPRGTSGSELCLFLACPPLAPCWLPPVVCGPPEGEDCVKPKASKSAYLPVLKSTGRLNCRDNGDEDEGGEDDEEEGLIPSQDGGGGVHTPGGCGSLGSESP